MRRLYQNDEVGEVQYAEGEYNHPFDSRGYNRLSPGDEPLAHWIPSTYYCSHALAPIMFITDTHPVSVNALSIPRSERRYREIERPARRPRWHHPLSHGQQFGRPNYGAEDARARRLVSDPRFTWADGESTFLVPPAPYGCCTSRGICERAMKVRRFTHQTSPTTLKKRDRQDMAAAISSQTTISPKPFAKTKGPISISIVGLRWRWWGIQAWRSCLDNGTLTRFRISVKNPSERSTRTTTGHLGPKTRARSATAQHQRVQSAKR